MDFTENYFDHDADMGLIGRGKTLEQAFINAAYALFALMAELSQVRLVEEVGIDFTEADNELAFVTWLNLLIAKAEEKHMVFADFHLEKSGQVWHGLARGEKWHRGIEPGIEVKAATLMMLSVQEKDSEWEARCIVDV
jgi:SHS2 domain-containing protein